MRCDHPSSNCLKGSNIVAEGIALGNPPFEHAG